ncbi:hypothetical protein Scep_015425 [Stephania cephalantha]|uniref:Zinc knuckle CX2CX4HX4C domain-containing protein n=1 Tax=Stephania cephalantha TaxID=152367 RepID=A0AAP0P1G0_9MAGN
MRRKKIISGFKPIFVEFKYERIKVTCHICGKITHFKHLCDQDHPAGQSYLYGDWMLVEYLPKQPTTQRGEPSRRRTASRGTSSENMEHKMKDQNISDSDMSLSDKNKSPVHLVVGSNHSQSIGNFSGSSSNQVSEDAGAKSALQVAMHISLEIHVAFYNNIPLGLDLVRPYTIPNRPEVVNPGKLFADLLAQAQQMLAEPTMDITYPTVMANNPNNQNIVVISDDTSGSVRVPLRPLNWKQRARGSMVQVEDEMQDVEME